MTIDWKPEYSVKVKEIDDQHKRLVATIDRLSRAIDSSKTKSELKFIFKELANYAKNHFATEEKYFDKFKYKYSKEHKEEHRLFKEKIKEFNKKLKNHEVEISFELIDYLEDWLLNHLVEQDQKYVKCFTEHGLH